jgi:hypothetical protein
MTARAVLAPDLLLAAVAGDLDDADAAAARRKLRSLVDVDATLLVAAPTWPALLDALRSKGWPASRIAEALHVLDDLDVQTIEVDPPALLLAADLMERRGLAAAEALAVVLADLEQVPLVSGGPTPDDGEPAVHEERSAPSTLPDYRGLGPLLAGLRRASTDGARGPDQVGAPRRD